ncbi:MAG: cation diffusion facilitator family transporter [Vicingaceae bacterium]
MHFTSRNIALKTIYFSIFGSILLAAIKGLTGYLGNSFALIADGIESLTDVFSSIIVLLGIRYATKPPDKNHPYGHGKAEPLITFIIVILLLVAAVGIAYKSIVNIQTPHESPKLYTLLVLLIVVTIKELFYRYINKKSVETNSSSLKADAWHHRSDAITSLFAAVGIAIALIFGDGYEVADDWAALAASFFIVYNAYLIFRPALGEIMDEDQHDDLIRKIRAISKTVPGVIDTEKCFIRKSGMSYHVDLHITVASNISVKKGHDIAHHLKDVILKQLPQIVDVLIHVEPDDL